MKTKFQLIIVLIISLLTVTGAFAQISFDMDKTVDFSNFKSYSILPMQNDSSVHLNDLDKDRLLNALKKEMENRGFNLVDENGDVKMAIFVIVQNKKSINAYTDYTGGYGYGMRRGFGYGYGAGGMATSTTSVVEDNYREGTTIVDCYDEGSKKLIWQGIYKGEVQEKAQKRDKTVPKHMHSIMNKFPVKEIKQ